MSSMLHYLMTTVNNKITRKVKSAGYVHLPQWQVLGLYSIATAWWLTCSCSVGHCQYSPSSVNSSACTMKWTKYLEWK